MPVEVNDPVFDLRQKLINDEIDVTHIEQSIDAEVYDLILNWL